MTAIAGCVGEPSDSFEAVCALMLSVQRAYGSPVQLIESWRGATFGSTPSASIPEDRLNARPSIRRERYLFAADVRLDNRDDLLRDLDIPVQDPRGKLDADILLEAWMRWNHDCLGRILGDYAFAIFDCLDRTLTLVRDPTGQRPLFYARNKDAVAFASMPNALLGSGLFSTSFRHERLASMLIGNPHAGDSTYFEGIFRVLPGHLTVLSASSALTRPYWSPPTGYLRLSNSEYVEAYREQLESAVRPRLERSSGLLGVHLSSGYDSNAVAAEAARLSIDSRPLAFTAAPRLGFDGPVPRGRIADESELAAVAAELYGTRHFIVRPSDGPLTKLRQHARIYQEPDRNIINMEWWTAILAAARELGVSTMLTGQMGNLSIHAGGLPTLAEWCRGGAWIRWLKEATAAARQPDVRWRGVLMNSFGEMMPKPLVQGLSRLFTGSPALADQSFLRGEWLARIPPHEEQDCPIRSNYPDRLKIIRLQDPGLFRKGALAESGIEERDPTADRRLLDFSFTLPPEQFLHNGKSRPLARNALAGRVPTSILEAPLRGYQGADWHERLNKNEARQVLEEISSSSVVNDMLDLKKIEQAIDDWPTEGTATVRARTIYRNRLPIALSTGVFLQEFEPSIGTSSSSVN